MARLRRFKSPSRSRIRLDQVTRNPLAARNNEAWGLGKIYRRVGKVGITDDVPLACEIRERKKDKKFLYVNGTSSLTAPVCCGRGRLREVVVYERIQYKALTEDIFGVLGRWSPTEVVARGGSTVVHNSA